MKTAQDIILKPIITEASMDGMSEGKYTFKVAPDATKPEIAAAVEEVFKSDKIKVGAVRIINMKKKPKRLGVHAGYTGEWKKAIVTLKEGKIEFFEGLN